VYLTGVLLPFVSEAVEEGSCAPSLTNQPFLKYGQTVSCQINPVGEDDIFRFFGNAEDRITLKVLNDKVTGRPCFQLFDPDGGSVTGGCSVLIDRDIPLTKTGPYSLRISELGNNELLNYSLTLDCLTGNCNTTVLPGSPDMNGDGKDDMVIRRGNRFFIDLDGKGGFGEDSFTYGVPSDLVFTADMDGDGADELVIRRGNRFLIDTDNRGRFAEDIISFGAPGDFVFPTDINGDGRDELVIQRGNRFFIDTGHDGRFAEKVFSYGRSRDVRLQGFGSQ
jgi:hypothetical protein